MKKVLVVDDDKELLHLIELLLTRKGFDVSTNHTGLLVLETVRSFAPDVVLLDIRLPKKSGIEICNEVKKFFNIPIILYSAHTDWEFALRGCKAEAFIPKPFAVEELVNLIKYHAAQPVAKVFTGTMSNN